MSGTPERARLSLDRIILYVRDVDALTAFYRDVLGFRLVETIGGEWAVLAAGRCELALHRVGAAYRGTSTHATRETNNAKLVLTVDGATEPIPKATSSKSSRRKVPGRRRQMPGQSRV